MFIDLARRGLLIAYFLIAGNDDGRPDKRIISQEYAKNTAAIFFKRGSNSLQIISVTKSLLYSQTRDVISIPILV